MTRPPLDLLLGALGRYGPRARLERMAAEGPVLHVTFPLAVVCPYINPLLAADHPDTDRAQLLIARDFAQAISDAATQLALDAAAEHLRILEELGEALQLDLEDLDPPTDPPTGGHPE